MKFRFEEQGLDLIAVFAGQLQSLEVTSGVSELCDEFVSLLYLKIIK